MQLVDNDVVAGTQIETARDDVLGVVRRIENRNFLRLSAEKITKALAGLLAFSPILA